MLVYGSYGLWKNDIPIPVVITRTTSRFIHLHDDAAVMMVGALGCACLVMLSIVVEHYDQRDNERIYRRFAQVTTISGWLLAACSIFSWLSEAAG